MDTIKLTGEVRLILFFFFSKRPFLKHLIFTISLLFCFILSKGNEADINLANSLDLSGFSETQKAIIKKESNDYALAIAHLYQSDRDAWKEKIHEMLFKLRDGLRVYKLARDPDLEEKIRSFDSTANAKVYVLSYVEDAFLNNIFLRLAEAYYETSRPLRFVIFKYKFKKSPAYTFENPRYVPARPDIELAYSIEVKLTRVLSDLTTICNNAIRSGDANGDDIVSDAAFQGRFRNSVNLGIDWLLGANVKDGPILGPIDCQRFCNMCGAERCAFIFQNLISNYGFSSYLIVTHGGTYKFSGTIKLDETNSIQVEKEFINDSKYFEEYAQYLEAWGVNYLYTGLIKMNYPQTKWEDYIPWGDNNNCKDHCISFSTSKIPPPVKLLTDVITSPYTAPVKILYGRNFIFEDEEVTKLDRGLAFLDIPGIGVITKTIAVKLGIKAMLMAGIVKTINTTNVLDDIIKRSGVNASISSLAKNAIANLPDVKKIFIFNGLTKKIIKIEDIPQFTEVVKTSDNWDDVLRVWDVLPFKNIEEFWSKIPLEFRRSVQEAFVTGTGKLKYAEKDMILYRHITKDGKAINYWMADKILPPQKARELLALPNSNSADWIAEIRIKKGTPYIEGQVASQINKPDIFGPYAKGGGIQYYFLQEYINNDFMELVKPIYVNN